MDNAEQQQPTTDVVPPARNDFVFFKNAPMYPENNIISTKPVEMPQEQGQSHGFANIKDNLMSLDAQIDGLTKTSVEAIEDQTLLYIKLLHPDDKYFIKFNTVHEQGEKFIKYLKSPEYIQYKKSYKSLESRYSNKKLYYIKVTKNKVLVHKIDKEGNVNYSGILDSLHRPSYINVTELLDKHCKLLDQKRYSLRTIYNVLTSKPFITQDTKIKFIRARDAFIDKINDFYAIQYYYNKINGIRSSSKIITLQKIDNYYSDNIGYIVPRLINKDIYMADDEFSNLYDNETKRLELYNTINANILAGLDGNKTDLKTYIKEYLALSTTELTGVINKKINYIPINYLVVPHELPYPDDNKLLKLSNYKEFYAAKNKVNSL